MHLPDSSGWHRAMNSLDFLRMPLFSILSGFLYAGNRVSASAVPAFLRKKANRLLVPLVVVTTVMFMLRRATYDDTTSLPTALLFHYQHLWFLQALFVIFVAISMWDAFARPTWVGLLVAAFSAVLISRSFDVTPFFSLNGVLYLAPFFLFGMILKTEPSLLRSKELFTLAGWLVLVVLSVQQATMIFGASPIVRTSLPAAVCGVCAGYLMIVACPRIALFEVIGAYSFTIYLWHSIAAAAVRETLRSYVHLSVPGEFLLLLTAGLVVPIAMHVAVERIPMISLLVAGIRSSRTGTSKLQLTNIGQEPARESA
jgi:glucans biosynthesis protein C